MEIEDTRLTPNALVCPLVVGCRGLSILGFRSHQQMHRNP